MIWSVPQAFIVGVAAIDSTIAAALISGIFLILNTLILNLMLNRKRKENDKPDDKMDHSSELDKPSVSPISGDIGDSEYQ